MGGGTPPRTPEHLSCQLPLGFPKTADRDQEVAVIGMCPRGQRMVRAVQPAAQFEMASQRRIGLVEMRQLAQREAVKPFGIGALRYVSYPVQVLCKSCKPVPVLLGEAIVAGEPRGVICNSGITPV